MEAKKNDLSFVSRMADVDKLVSENEELEKIKKDH